MIKHKDFTLQWAAHSVQSRDEVSLRLGTFERIRLLDCIYNELYCFAVQTWQARHHRIQFRHAILFFPFEKDRCTCCQPDMRIFQNRNAYLYRWRKEIDHHAKFISLLLLYLLLYLFCYPHLRQPDPRLSGGVSSSITRICLSLPLGCFPPLAATCVRLVHPCCRQSG